MRATIIALLFSVLGSSNAAAQVTTGAAITYALSDTRFGDNLLSFSHAAWFAYVLDMPLLYQPFPYSEQLALHNHPFLIKEKHFYASNKMSLFSKKDHLKFFNLLSTGKSLDGFLFELSYYPETPTLFTPQDYDDASKRGLFTQVNWDDAKFLQLLRSLIKPIKAMPKPQLPVDRTSVALHYRTGIGFDNSQIKLRFPLKFPPDDYYVEALSYLYKALGKPLYVYIFTDHPNPTVPLKKFSSSFKDHNIIFDCRKADNHHDLNVLEDFFAMESYDCLIRGESNFSIMASFIFPFKAILSPAHFQRDANDKVHIDQIMFQYGPTDKIKRPIRTVLRKNDQK